MMRRMAILFLSLVLILFLTIPSLALTKEERAWKEDILTLLSLVKRVGDYSEVVDLIEVAPALKEDPEIRKAFITFAPPGATPPEWAREKEPVLPAKIEIPKEIPVEVKEEPAPPPVETEIKKEKIPPEITEEKKEEARRIALEVGKQKKPLEIEEKPPVEIIKEEPKIEVPKEVAIIEGPPEKIAIAEAPKEKERREREEEEIKKGLEVIPTPLPKGAEVIHSTDVVSEVRAEIAEGKVRVTITLSGERKYTVSERSRPPAIVIDIPHTINAVSPERIVVNQGGVRTIEVTQHRTVPFDEVRIMVILNRWTEYQVTHKNNEIYIDFEE